MVDNHVLPSPLSRSEGERNVGGSTALELGLYGGWVCSAQTGREGLVVGEGIFALFETLTYSATAGRRRAGVGRKCDSCARRSGTSSRGTATGIGCDVTCEWYVRL